MCERIIKDLVLCLSLQQSYIIIYLVAVEKLGVVALCHVCDVLIPELAHLFINEVIIDDAVMIRLKWRPLAVLGLYQISANMT